MCAGIRGGWRKNVHLNITAADACPGASWIKSGVSFCRVANDTSYSCSSVHFSTNKVTRECVVELEDTRRGTLGGFYGKFMVNAIDGVYQRQI